MKKQTHPSIKAHLLWSALILLSLLAVCAIPFALAQSRGRGTTKRSGAARVPPMPASQLPTGLCLTVNGGFETGDLTGWTNTGDTSSTAVNNVNPHSGTFALEAGPANGEGFLDQVIPTVAGTAYDVSFWLANDDDSGDNR